MQHDKNATLTAARLLTGQSIMDILENERHTEADLFSVKAADSYLQLLDPLNPPNCVSCDYEFTNPDDVMAFIVVFNLRDANEPADDHQAVVAGVCRKCFGAAQRQGVSKYMIEQVNSIGEIKNIYHTSEKYSR